MNFAALKLHFLYNALKLIHYHYLYCCEYYPQAEQMYRRMVFNVLARNCDDHTKNFAFMMGRNGVWKLAPAYDVCHAYRPGSPWVSQQSLSLNGKRQGFTRADLLAVAKQMNVKKAENIINQVQNALTNWPEYASECKVEEVLQEAIKKTFVVV